MICSALVFVNTIYFQGLLWENEIYLLDKRQNQTMDTHKKKSAHVDATCSL